ncbi:MAG TPA: TonB-dependent receptor [Opitutaceae bacterium]
MKSIRRPRARGARPRVPSVVAALAVPASAFAQLVPSPSPAETGEEPVHVLEAFVATGSNIKRLDQEKALPVTVFNRELIETREASTPVQLLTALPQVVNVPLGETTNSAIAARGDNSSVNLRGLGSGNTLVLLNGRRLVPHPLSSIDEASVPSLSVNVNQLPNRGIQRVDVLRDGASSIYGTDAVAGVINYVMDREFRGAELAARVVVPEEGDGLEYRGTVTAGYDFAAGRGRFITVLDYFDRDPIAQKDRAFSSDPDRTQEAPPLWQTPNTGPFFDIGGNSLKFGNFYLGGYDTSGRFVRGRPSHVPAGTAANNGRFYMLPTANGVGFKPTTPSRTDPYEKLYYFDGTVTGYLQNKTTRENWFTQLEYDLTDRLTAFGELGYYHAHSVLPGEGIASGFTAGSPAVSYSNPQLIVPADSPWNPFGSRFYAPDGSPNPDGTPRLVGTPAPLEVQNARFIGINGGDLEVDNWAYRALGGIRGRFGDTWTWESAVLYSHADGEDRDHGRLRQSVMRDLVANGRLNPFGYTFKIDGGAVVVDQPYVNNAGDFPGLLDTMKRDGETVLSSIDFRASGELFELRGNPVSLAFGGEYRQDEFENFHYPYSGFNPPDSGLDPGSSDFVGSSPAGNAAADRTVASFYTEILVPLVAPRQALPLVHSLEVSASGRTEHYSDFGQTTKPKVSLNWRPTPWIMVRASYNEGFRAPNLSVLYSADLPRQRSIADPYRQPVTGLPTDASFSRPFTLLANPELDPEEATGKSAGVVIEVPFVKGLSFSFDYWEIEQTNVIVSPFDSLPADDFIALSLATQQQLTAGVPIDQVDLGSGTDNYRGAHGMVRAPVTDEDRAFFAAYNATRAPADQLGAVGGIERLFSQYVNRAEGTFAGFDVGVNYQLPAFAWGRLTLSSDWAYTTDAYYVPGPDEPTDELRYDNPRLRGSSNVTWRFGPWSAGLAAYYIGEYLDSNAFLTAPQYESYVASSGGAPGYLQGVEDNGVRVYRYVVDDLWTFNTFLSYRFLDRSDWLGGVSLRLGVANVTDEEPPMTSDGFSPAINSNVIAGRTWSLEVAKRF